MAVNRDPLLDYINGQSQRTTGGTSATAGGSLPPIPGGAGETDGDTAELKELQRQRGQADNNRLRLMQERTAIQQRQGSLPPDDEAGYTSAKAQIEQIDAQIRQYDAEVKTLDTQIARVRGTIASRVDKPPAPTLREQGDEQLRVYQEKARIDAANAPGKTPYDPANDAELQRFYLRRAAEAGDTEAARALASGNLQLANDRLGLERRKLEVDIAENEAGRQLTREQSEAGRQLTREQMEAARRENAAGRESTLLERLIGETGQNQRDTAGMTMQTYYKQLEKDVAQGRLDEGAATRKLEAFKANLDYAKQYGLDSDFKPGYGNVAALSGLYGAKVDPGPWKQEKFDPFRAMGITPAGLAGGPIKLPDRQPPPIPTLDTGQQVYQAQTAMSQIPAFNAAQMPNFGAPPAPPQPPPALMPQQQAPLSRMVPGVRPPQAPLQPPPGIERPAPPPAFNAAGGMALYEQWRRERQQRGEDPDDLGAFAEHMDRI